MNPGRRWHPAATEVAPRAAVGRGEVARRLHAWLAAQPSASRESLSATSAPGWLVVLGTAGELPWIDGLRYAAPHPDAPALWLPTHLTPDEPADLLARALERQHGRAPLLLWPDPAAVLPLDRARLASDEVLAAIAAARRAEAAA